MIAVGSYVGIYDIGRNGTVVAEKIINGKQFFVIKDEFGELREHTVHDIYSIVCGSVVCDRRRRNTFNPERSE